MSKKLLNPLTKKLFLVSLFSLFISITAFANDDTWCGHIDGFKFKSGNSSVMINNYGTYSINELPNNFYIQLIVGGYSQSAKFYLQNLSTGATYNLTENYEPYTFPGGGSAWNYGTGVFKLKAKLYKYNYCGGWTCDTETVQFTITNASSCGQVDGFTFTNGVTSTDIVNGNSYEVSDLPTNFFVESVVTGNSESVKLILKNLDTNQTFYVGENYEPYTIPGGGSVWNYGYGNFKLTSKVYIYDYCQSTVCDQETIYFTLNNTVSCGELTALNFTNGDESVALNDGQSYNIQDLPANFYIDSAIEGDVSKVKYYVTNLDTNTTTGITESVAPYTYPSTGSSWNLGTGNFKITAKLYTTTISYYGNNCGSSSQTMVFCDKYTYTFTLTDSAVCGSIDGFAFTDGVNSNNIVDGQSYYIEDIPTDFYINTLTNGEVENVQLEVTNLDTYQTFSITESVTPYTYPAGAASWNLGLGNFQLTAKLYSQSASSYSNNNNNCGDNNDNSLILCEEQTIQFTLLEQACEVLAGTGIPSLDVIVIPLGNTFNINITPNDDNIVPSGYNLGTVLASIDNQIIYSVSENLTLTLPYLNGPYNVHMFVYDPLTFDISSINLGTDTIADVQNVINNNNICADIANTGSQIVIIPGGVDQRAAQTETEDKSKKDQVNNSTNSALQQLVVAKVEEEEALTNAVKLYPNPVVDYLTVDLVFNEGEIFEFTITDLRGKQVMKGNVANKANTINLNQLVNGLYIIKLKSGFRTISKKIVVRK